MRSIQFLAIRWLLISCLVVVGILAIPQVVDAGTPGEEAVFTISGLSISPTEASTGQSITISATINETNNKSGIYEGTLRINGTVEETKSVTVGPMGSEQITFTISKDEAGEYSVNLNGLTGSLTVTGEPANGSSDSSFPTTPLIIGIISAVVVVGLIVYYLNRRKAA